MVAIAATDKGVIYEGAIGRRDMDKRPDMTPDTVFWIASMTKAVTATACMQLVEQGKLQLDEPVGELLPDLAEPQVLEGFDASGQPKLRPASEPITLRHLLTHTAGFVYSIWSEPMLQYEKVTGSPFIGTCKTASLSAPLMFDPGERWEYGINIDWVGKAVEAVSGQSLEIYFREHIFEPLGMIDTGFLIGSTQKARVATHVPARRGRCPGGDPVRRCRRRPSSSWAVVPSSARPATTWPSCRCSCTTAPSTVRGS